MIMNHGSLFSGIGANRKAPLLGQILPTVTVLNDFFHSSYVVPEVSHLAS